ncbi:breast cancer anti-estrogen resistance protein 1 isoform X1 [Ixodes scapularis]|uniref:breast cancer anti-estrogen resistance protein 1 isoform X1 n=1 Tax=Ixodes scapularis TaxID=6945 RepID=UPI001A9FB7D9|nr:breast cancer anti-estrogen resistance protein 1 isoform X1 [Ixodes scapularis]
MNLTDVSQSALLAHRLKCRRAAANQPLNCLARALYDNIAESPEELAFRKNDVLTVLEQNPGDLEGWWLCALRGRQGLAPGNRLRLMPGMYDPTGLGYATGTAAPGGHADASLLSAVPPAAAPSTYPGPGQRHARRRSWRVDANKVVTPNKIGDVYLYDVPAGAKIPEEYDVPAHSTLPRPVTHVHADTVIPAPQEGRKPLPATQGMAYDEPRPFTLSYDTPRSSLNSHGDVTLSVAPGAEWYDVPRPQADYDVPSSEPVGAYATPPPPRGIAKVASSTYDVPVDSGTLRCVAATTYDVPVSGRSSGVSLLSTSSSSAGVSPASSQSSLNTSLSLSSLCGSNRSSLEQGHEAYDIPVSGPRRVADTCPNVVPSRGGLGTVPPPPGHSTTLLQFYDVPTNNAPAPYYDTPPKRGPITQGPCMDGVYDVPPQVTRDAPLPLVMDETDSKRHSSSSSDSRGSRDYEAVGELRELHLERDAALEMLVKVQQEVSSAISKLFSLTHSTLKRQESATNESRLYDLKTSCHKLRTSLREFLNFAQGALANAAHLEDRKLCQKLARLAKPLVDSYQVVVTTTQALDDKGWQISATRDTSAGPDELDQLIACARGLTEDIQQIASTIQGNSTLIFKKSPLISESGRPMQERPLPVPPKRDDDQWASDYDYVNLESKASVERENEEIKAALPAELGLSFDKLLQQSQLIVEGVVQEPPTLSCAASLDQNDLQILNFYGAQIDTHILFLTSAIDAFLATIENNQPPKVFIGHSKFVVISAHKLVYMGDTVYRNVLNADVRAQVLQCSSNLCEALKGLISSTKKAALQFPSVAAVQEMVDSIVDVSHLANDLKVSVTQATR